MRRGANGKTMRILFKNLKRQFRECHVPNVWIWIPNTIWLSANQRRRLSHTLMGSFDFIIFLSSAIKNRINLISIKPKNTYSEQMTVISSPKFGFDKSGIALIGHFIFDQKSFGISIIITSIRNHEKTAENQSRQNSRKMFDFMAEARSMIHELWHVVSLMVGTRKCESISSNRSWMRRMSYAGTFAMVLHWLTVIHLHRLATLPWRRPLRTKNQKLCNAHCSN